MMFDLDGLDIQTIREASIARDADLREILIFHELNDVECHLPIENSLDCISRVMKKISNRVRAGGKL